MREGLNIFIMEIIFAIFGKEFIKNISIFTFGTFIKSFLSIVVHRNNNIVGIKVSEYLQYHEGILADGCRE